MVHPYIQLFSSFERVKAVKYFVETGKVYFSVEISVFDSMHYNLYDIILYSIRTRHESLNLNQVPGVFFHSAKLKIATFTRVSKDGEVSKYFLSHIVPFAT